MKQPSGDLSRAVAIGSGPSYICFLRRDQGKELVNNTLKAFLQGREIEFVWTNATPEGNCLVEKMNGMLMVRVRSLLTTTHMPQVAGETFAFAVKAVNFSPCSALSGETQYTRQLGERPNVEKLWIWGCVVHILTPKATQANKWNTLASWVTFWA